MDIVPVRHRSGEKRISAEGADPTFDPNKSQHPNTEIVMKPVAPLFAADRFRGRGRFGVSFGLVAAVAFRTPWSSSRSRTLGRAGTSSLAACVLTMLGGVVGLPPVAQGQAMRNPPGPMEVAEILSLYEDSRKSPGGAAYMEVLLPLSGHAYGRDLRSATWPVLARLGALVWMDRSGSMAAEEPTVPVLAFLATTVWSAWSAHRAVQRYNDTLQLRLAPPRPEAGGGVTLQATVIP